MANNDAARLVGIILNDDGTINKFVVEQEDHEVSEIPFVGVSSEETQTLIDSSIPKHLGFAESLATWGPVDIGPTDAQALFIPFLSISADVGVLPVEIQLYLPSCNFGAVDGLVQIEIYDDTDDVVLQSALISIKAYTYQSVMLSVFRDDLSPGVHLIKGRAWAGNDGAVFQISGGEIYRQWLSVKEVSVPA